MFTIDGETWPYPCSLTRTTELRASEVSGMLLDKSYFNDVLGTFMSYSVSVAVPLNKRDLYTSLYRKLSDPVDGHTFVLPHDQGELTVTGRVQNISDVYVRLPGGGLTWKGIRFDIVANHPTRSYSLSEAIEQGQTPLPVVADHHEGDTWVWSNNTWVLSVSYDDADAKRY